MQQLIRVFEFEGGGHDVVSSWTPSAWARPKVEKAKRPSLAERLKLAEEDPEVLH